MVFQPSLKIEAIGVADIRRAEWKPRFKARLPREFPFRLYRRETLPIHAPAASDHERIHEDYSLAAFRCSCLSSLVHHH